MKKGDLFSLLLLGSFLGCEKSRTDVLIMTHLLRE